jgi:hypothetical protein
MEHDPLIPNVWICLQKIRAFLDGDYPDKDDVYLCLDAMERMFEFHKIKHWREEEGLCKSGHLEESGG